MKTVRYFNNQSHNVKQLDTSPPHNEVLSEMEGTCTYMFLQPQVHVI